MTLKLIYKKINKNHFLFFRNKKLQESNDLRNNILLILFNAKNCHNLTCNTVVNYLLKFVNLKSKHVNV